MGCQRGGECKLGMEVSGEALRFTSGEAGRGSKEEIVKREREREREREHGPSHTAELVRLCSRPSFASPSEWRV